MERGQDISHERIAATFVVKQPGYVYVYISNDETTPLEVFFDDFNLTHAKGPVVQSQDYYPFGLTFNSYNRENAATQNYKYNGKEEQDDLGLDWLDYGARMYMPEIGRWGVLDPFSENYSDWSPYVYALDNPIRFIDPNGKEVEDGITSETVVTSTMDKYKRLHVTSTTTVTTTTTAKDGKVTVVKKTTSATNIISSDPSKSTERGDVTTTTKVSVDGKLQGDPTSSIVSQADFKGDLSALNNATTGLEEFRNEHGMQFNEYLLEHGIKGLDVAFKAGMLPVGVTGLGLKLPEKLGKLLGTAGVPTSAGEIQKQASEKFLNDQTPIIIQATRIEAIPLKLPERRNPKEGWVRDGHQLLYDIVFGWWID